MKIIIGYVKKNYLESYFLLLIVTFLIYYYALTSFFIAEDLIFISLFHQFDFADIFRLFIPLNKVAQQGPDAFIRFVTVGLWAFDYIIWGDNPFGYHFTNIFLHFLNSTFVFLIVYKTFNNRYWGIASAILFSIFPANVEAVAWISGRFDVLSSFFYLLSILLFINFVKNKKTTPYLFSLLAAILGVFSKEIAFTIPISIILWDVFFGREFREEKYRNRVKWYIPYFLIIFAALVWRILIYSGAGGYGDAAGRSLQFTNYLNKWIIKGLMIKFPLRLLAPINYQSNEMYWWYIVICLLTFFIILIIYNLIKKSLSKGLLFSILFIFISILPVYNMIGGVSRDLQASRLLYLPSVGFCIGLTYLIFNTFTDTQRQKRLKIVTLVFLFIFYTSASFQNIKIWSDASNLVREVILQLKRLYPPVSADANIFFVVPYDIKGWVIPFSSGAREITSYAYNYWKPRGSYEKLRNSSDFIAYSKKFVNQYIENSPFISTILLNYDEKTKYEFIGSKIHISKLIEFINTNSKNRILFWNEKEDTLLEITEDFLNNVTSRNLIQPDNFSLLNANNFNNWNIDSSRVDVDGNILKIKSNGENLKLLSPKLRINPLDFDEIEIRIGGVGDKEYVNIEIAWNQLTHDNLYKKKNYRFKAVMDNRLRNYSFNLIDNLDWAFEKNIRDISLSFANFEGNLNIEAITLNKNNGIYLEKNGLNQ